MRDRCWIPTAAKYPISRSPRWRRPLQAEKVSQADYERAWADYKQCIIDKGYAEPTFDKYDNGIYALPSYNTDDASKEAIRKLNDDLTSCSMLHVTDINTVYRLQLGNPKLLLDDKGGCGRLPAQGRHKAQRLHRR